MSRRHRVRLWAGSHSIGLVSAAITALTAVLYIRTAGPTLGGVFDSEEFQHAAYTLSVAHATGYPLYLLLGKLFVTVFAYGNIAYRMNILSAVIGALAAGLVYLVALKLTNRPIASAAAAALFATNPAVWRQSGVASVGPLHLLLAAALIYTALDWHTRRRKGKTSLVPIAFVFGLGLAHHSSTIVLAPAIILLVLLTDPDILRRGRELGVAAGAFLLPLLLYLYIPLRGGATPWYNNTLEGFIGEVTGGSAESFMRTTLPDLAQGIASVLQYLFSSFGYLGVLLVLAGLASVWPGRNRWQTVLQGSAVPLFLAVCTLIFAIWGTVYGGEPDRYLVLPFFFLVFWFAAGAASVENWIESFLVPVFIGKLASALPLSPPREVGREADGVRAVVTASSPLPVISSFPAPPHERASGQGEEAIEGEPLDERSAIEMSRPVGSKRAKRLELISQSGLAIVLVLFLALPFGDRYQTADWSSYDRVYKQWDEIFSLPLPQRSVLVGNWPQLNAMRYMQRVENRRPDLEFVGTLYDPAPQTEAAHTALAEGRALFLSPGIALPNGSYRYGQVGPLLQVRDKPEAQPASAVGTQSMLSLTPSLKLADDELSPALEPYRPGKTASVAPNRTVRVTLTWFTAARTDDFLVRLQLYDPEDRLIAQTDEPPVRGLYAPSRWTPEEYVSDVHNLLIPAGSPPGKYSTSMTLLEAGTKNLLSAPVRLGSVIILPATNLDRESVFVQHKVDIDAGPQLAIWGYGGLDGTLQPGTKLTFYLLWSVRQNLGPNEMLAIVLLDSHGRRLQQWDKVPIGFYPTETWQRGEILKAYYDVDLPMDLPSGSALLAVGVGPSSQPGELVSVAAIRIAP